MPSSCIKPPMVPAAIRHQANPFQELTGLRRPADLSCLQHKSNGMELPDSVKWNGARPACRLPSGLLFPRAEAGAAPLSIALDRFRDGTGEEGWSQLIIQGWQVRP